MLFCLKIHYSDIELIHSQLLQLQDHDLTRSYRVSLTCWSYLFPSHLPNRAIKSYAIGHGFFADRARRMNSVTKTMSPSAYRLSPVAFLQFPIVYRLSPIIILTIAVESGFNISCYFCLVFWTLSSILRLCLVRLPCFFWSVRFV